MTKAKITQNVETLIVSGKEIPLAGAYYIKVNGISVCPDNLKIVETDTPGEVIVSFPATMEKLDIKLDPEQEALLKRFFSSGDTND